MIFLNRHGHMAVTDCEADRYDGRKVMPASQACGFGTHEDYGDVAFGPFDYFFPDAPPVHHSTGATALLDTLADAMVETASGAETSRIPPAFTYLGQFIDHDITANTDREAGLSIIDVDEVMPVDRDTVIRGLGNLRAGALNLDSLYGGGPNQGAFARTLASVLRFPGDRAKLWVGEAFDAGFGEIPVPADPARDLLRLGRVMREPDAQLTEAKLRALPEPLRGLFFNKDGSLKIQRAIIGDARNDENLAVAQLHLAFVRFHNKVVDEAHLHLADSHNREAVFAWARRMVTWHYQWLVLHVYLPTICDPGIVSDVIAAGAPLYWRFLARVGHHRPDLMPLPLEFSVAAFRFGHSLARASYDWNRLFGRPADGSAPLSRRATFVQLFEFTGDAAAPMPLPGGGSSPQLPAQWPVEWSRFALPVPDDMPDRSARPIDTQLALPLSDMVNQDPGVLRHLARRNLRRGLRLNIPSAQSCAAALASAARGNV